MFAVPSPPSFVSNRAVPSRRPRSTYLALIVSLWAGGSVDLVAALSFINITLVAIGLGLALRFGVKLSH